MAEFDAEAARAKRPMPLWVDAFTRDTTMLETDEVGAYLMILMAMWTQKDMALPNDPRRLARAAGVSVRLWNSRIWPALEPFFSECPEGITQKRLRREGTYVQRQVTQQSNRKRGINPEKPNKNNDTPQTADITTDKPAEHPSQQPNNLHKKKEPIGSKEKENSGSIPLFGDDQKKPPKKKKRACQLPEGWVPNEKNIADAKKLDFTDWEIENEGNQFRDYHHAKGTIYVDWNASWRTWIRNAIKFGRRTGAQNGRGMGVDAKAAEIADRATRYAQDIAKKREAGCDPRSGLGQD